VEISHKNTKVENKTEKTRATSLYIRKNGRKKSHFLKIKAEK